MIENMTTQEKSKVLIEMMGWQPAIIKGKGSWWVDANYKPVFKSDYFPRAFEYPNLYIGENMALAWRVLNWAHDNQVILSAWKIDDYPEFFFDMWELTPAEAQTRWLDEILELAIEAGMVKRD